MKNFDSQIESHYQNKHHLELNPINEVLLVLHSVHVRQQNRKEMYKQTTNQ